MTTLTAGKGTVVPRTREAARRAAALRAARSDAFNIAPAAVLYTVFLIGPAFLALFLSFFKWNGVARLQWVGLANWHHLLSDSQAARSLWLTVQVTVVGWVIIMAVSMAAGLTTAGSNRLAAVLSGLYVVPLLLSTAGLGLIWQALLAPSLGGVAYLGTSLKLPFLQTNWLGNPSTVVYVITVIMSWQLIPFYTLMYRAARQRIPESLYEAASLDGAAGFRAFYHVTLPQLRSTVVASTLLLIIGSFAYFDLFFLMTGGGPGTSSEVFSLYTYKQGFASQNFGYASVLTVVLVVISVAAGAVLLGATRYSTESREGGE